MIPSTIKIKILAGRAIQGTLRSKGLTMFDYFYCYPIIQKCAISFSLPYITPPGLIIVKGKRFYFSEYVHSIFFFW